MDDRVLNGLRRLWRGQVPLAIAFWRYAIVGGIAVNVVATGAGFAMIAADWPAAWALAVVGLHLPYNLFMAWAVWQSAARYRGPARWAELARPAVIAWTILMAVT